MKDGNGTDLQVGDVVNVPCVVRGVHHSNEDWNNVTLSTIGKNHPGQYHTELHLNAKQLEFVSRKAEEKAAPAEAVSTVGEDVLEQEQKPTTKGKK